MSNQDEIPTTDISDTHGGIDTEQIRETMQNTGSPHHDEREEQATEAHPSEEQSNYKQDREITREDVDSERYQGFEDALFFLMQQPEEAYKVIQEFNQRPPGDPDHLSQYANAIQWAFKTTRNPYRKVSPFGRKDSFWRQGMMHNNELISAAKPHMSHGKGRLSGENADMRIRAAAGLGTVVNIPLYHTGVWIKLKAPSESALLELERRIALDKITLGRASMGLAFTNHAVYFSHYLVNFILEHAYAVTYESLDPQQLKQVLRVTDIPLLVWGIALANWPNGYRLVRPCVSDPRKCSHIDSQHVNISKLLWVDNQALSTYQRNHMSNRDGQYGSSELYKYWNEHTIDQQRYIKINDNVSLRLSVPSIAEYEQAGFNWIDSIIYAVDDAFGQELRGNERDSYITQQGAMSSLRRYSHWISAIELDNGESVIDERHEIDNALGTLTGNDKLREQIIQEIERFMRECTVATIGIPRYDCPRCGGEPDPSLIPARQDELIQLEPYEIFFTLQRMSVSRLLNSE